MFTHHGNREDSPESLWRQVRWSVMILLELMQGILPPLFSRGTFTLLSSPTGHKEHSWNQTSFNILLEFTNTRIQFLFMYTNNRQVSSSSDARWKWASDWTFHSQVQVLRIAQSSMNRNRLWKVHRFTYNKLYKKWTWIWILYIIKYKCREESKKNRRFYITASLENRLPKRSIYWCYAVEWQLCFLYKANVPGMAIYFSGRISHFVLPGDITVIGATKVFLYTICAGMEISWVVYG